MRVTVDTNAKTLTIHGSFHYDDFVTFHQAIPKEWTKFIYLVEPVYYPTYETTITNQLPLFGDAVKSNN